MKTPEDICPDFPEWPDKWMIAEKDKAYGQGVIDAMRPFVEHLMEKKLKEKTIRSHMDNLWLLGGEIIRSVHIHQDYKVPPVENIRDSVDSEGGPYPNILTQNGQLIPLTQHVGNLTSFLTKKIKRAYHNGFGGG